MVKLNNDWDQLLHNQFSQPYYLKLRQYLIQEYSQHEIYPAIHEIFTALKLTPYKKTKVVILGQDPYPGPDQAHGLAFSVKPQVKIPRSLNNIFKELNSDLNCSIPDNGSLITWAEQGVLLLNTALTVRAHQPRSHHNKGWEKLTDYIIEVLNLKSEPIVFLLWGNDAKRKKSLVTSSHHLILTAAHPSPLSANRGFFGCQHFSQTNAFLSEQGLQPIDWQIPNRN